MTGRVLISLHDVTPFHLERVKRAEELFLQMGIGQVAYLLVPEFHHGHACDQSPAFHDFCRRTAPFAIDWMLHGFYHLEEDNPSRDSTWSEGLKRKWMTAGEGEFLAIAQKEASARIERGKAVFRRCLGEDPLAFIPPAWLHGEGLFGWLKAWGFLYTENHAAIHLLAQNRRFESPVVTWATRTWMRRKGSLWVCPALERMTRRSDLLRIALHPYDFDFPETRRNIEKVLKRALRRRQVIGWKSLLI